MFCKRLMNIMTICWALMTVSSFASAAQVAPENLQGRPVSDGVKLTWSTASGAGGYNVYRNNQYQTTVTNAPYTDTVENGNYSYYITAFDPSKQQFSGRSNEAIVTVGDTHPVDDPVPKQGIAAPALLVVQANSQQEALLNWQPVTGATGYNVYHNEEYLDTVLTGETYIHKNLIEGKNDYYVTAFDASREHFSAKSNMATFDMPSIDPPVNVDPSALVDQETWLDPNAHISGYSLVFSDEFNGSELSSHRWNTQLRWDGEYNGERYEYRLINGEKQFYVNIYSEDQEHLDTIVPEYNPFEFNGNRLAIRAIRNPLKTSNGNKLFGPLQEMVSQQHFLSGTISTFDKFSQKYGYFEARIKIPKHTGTFPAFWLHHQKKHNEGTRRTEIDIMENLGHAPEYIYNSFHSNDVHIKPQPQGQIFTGVHHAEDYHVYAVEWKPGHITWFIDGEKVSELESSHVDYEELYLIINLAMGGKWIDGPTNSGGLGRPYPNEQDLSLENFHEPALEIDYVRVYQRE